MLSKPLKDIIVIFCLSLTFMFCDSKNEPGMKTMNFVYFSIVTPSTWKFVTAEGLDSFAGGIKMEYDDTAYFDLGMYSDNLTEIGKFYLNDSTIFFATNEAPQIQGDSIAIYKNRKSNVVWDSVAGYKAKILSSVKPGFGVTGIYIDSVWQGNYSKVKFSFSGKKLHPENELKFSVAIKTLKFYKLQK